MTVYIAGGITGVEDYKARFAAAKRMLLREGEDRPISMEHYYGTPRADKVLNPAELPEGWPGKVYMDVCLAMMQYCRYQIKPVYKVEQEELAGWLEN